MRKKVVVMDSLYNGGKMEKETFVYERLWGLTQFTGQHPQVMKDWIKNHHQDILILKEPYRFQWKDFSLILSDFWEKITGIRVGEYRNYQIVK
jgi:hypothetical protein